LNKVTLQRLAPLPYLNHLRSANVFHHLRSKCISSRFSVYLGPGLLRRYASRKDGWEKVIASGCEAIQTPEGCSLNKVTLQRLAPLPHLNHLRMQMYFTIYAVNYLPPVKWTGQFH